MALVVFPFRAGVDGKLLLTFLLNLLRDSSLLYLLWQVFGRRTCDGCSTKNLSFYSIPEYRSGMCFSCVSHDWGFDLLV